MSESLNGAPEVAPRDRPSEDGARRRPVTPRVWIAIVAVTVVIAGVVVTAGVFAGQNAARETRIAAAQADFSAFSEAEAGWASEKEDYASAVLAAAADAAIYREIVAAVQATGEFDPGVVIEFDRVVTELSALAPGPTGGADPAAWETSVRENPAQTLGVEDPGIVSLTEQDVREGYAAGDDSYRATQLNLTESASGLAEATEKLEGVREELNAAHQRAVEAGAKLAVAFTNLPDEALAQWELATDDVKAAFVAAHASLEEYRGDTGAQGLLDAVAAYTDGIVALRASHEAAIAEAERIRREQAGTITVLTDFMYYLPYDQCIQAPGVAYTQTFDVSGGQNHTTAPDPAQDFDIWTYTVSGGTVSYFRCYAD